jgi:hypothetical protein
VEGAGRAIEQEILSWDGVTAHSHRFGGVEFRLGKVELGHLHGDRLADLPFPTKLRNELIEEGRAKPHHVLPSSGWVSRWINEATDVDEVIALFRLNYDRLTARRKPASS